MPTLSRRGQAAFIVTLALAVGPVAGCATRLPEGIPEGEAPPAEVAVKVQGQLTTEGVECQALRADDGTLYTLLGDLKGFKAGDAVVVDGTPVQISFCMQGTTLQIRSIARKPSQ